MLVDAERLRLRVAELAREISRDYAGTRPLLLVGVLKGAIFFLSDLMRLIEIPVEVDFMAVASYGSATDSSGVVRILKDLDAAIDDRDVLIVEDIVDSGLTLQYLLRNLGSRDPRTLEVCALLIKPDRSKGRPAHPLRRLRDSRPLRDRLRPRLRGAPPQPSIRGGVGARMRHGRLRRRVDRESVGHGSRDPLMPGNSDPSWYASRLEAVLRGGGGSRFLSMWQTAPRHSTIQL